MQILAKAELHRQCRVKQESLHCPVALGRFMQVLARQNYNGIDTETMVARNGICSEALIIFGIHEYTALLVKFEYFMDHWFY
jgi:hypothetical protein